MNAVLEAPRIQAPPIAMPPGENELPCDDGVPMETERHRLQMELLLNTLSPWLGDKGYTGGNMFLYYSAAQIKRNDFIGPDVFVALDVPRRERKSWVSWQEGKTPDVVIELLSESTAKYDKTYKKSLYESVLKVNEYFWFDPFNPEDRAGFRLNGTHYQPLDSTPLICETLGLQLVLWQGCYGYAETTWLRWASLEGELLPLAAEMEAARANAETARANAETARADAEAAARTAAERELEQLRAELARLKTT